MAGRRSNRGAPWLHAGAGACHAGPDVSRRSALADGCGASRRPARTANISSFQSPAPFWSGPRTCWARACRHRGAVSWRRAWSPSSPPFLMWLVMPMGDIPVAACWTRGARGGAVSRASRAPSELALRSALAILIRPNLVPLAMLVAFVTLVGWFGASSPSAPRLQQRRSRRAAGRGPDQLVGVRVPVPVRLRQPGSALFGRVRLAEYPALRDVVRVRADDCSARRADGSILSAVSGSPAEIAARSPSRCLRWSWRSYLPYTRFEDWSYLRFLLPAYPALFAGLAVVAWNAAERWVGIRWVRPALAVAIGLLVVRDLDYSNAAADLSRTEPRYKFAATAAAEAPRGPCSSRFSIPARCATTPATTCCGGI